MEFINSFNGLTLLVLVGLSYLSILKNIKKNVLW